MKSIKKINYDKKFDVLNLKFSDAKNSYGEEDFANVIMLKDIKTEKLTGITIISFKKLYLRKDFGLASISEYVDLKQIYNILVSKNEIYE